MSPTRPEKGSLWRLLFRESDRLPAGSIGAVVDPSDKAGEVELIFPGDRITFNLNEFDERCQQPAPEPSIGELAEAHEVLGRDAIELAHDIWCRDSHMDRALAAQGSTRAILLAAYPALRKKILADTGIEDPPKGTIICPRCHGAGFEERNDTGGNCILCHGQKYVPAGTKDFEGV